MDKPFQFQVELLIRRHEQQQRRLGQQVGVRTLLVKARPGESCLCGYLCGCPALSSAAALLH